MLETPSMAYHYQERFADTLVYQRPPSERPLQPTAIKSTWLIFSPPPLPQRLRFSPMPSTAYHYQQRLAKTLTYQRPPRTPHYQQRLAVCLAY